MKKISPKRKYIKISNNLFEVYPNIDEEDLSLIISKKIGSLEKIFGGKFENCSLTVDVTDGHDHKVILREFPEALNIKKHFGNDVNSSEGISLYCFYSFDDRLEE